jgi:Flp pilus assembly pilin Flp
MEDSMGWIRWIGRRATTCAHSLHTDERGQAMTEYTILMVATAISAIAAVTHLGFTLLGKFEIIDGVMDDFIAAVTANLGG